MLKITGSVIEKPSQDLERHESALMALFIRIWNRIETIPCSDILTVRLFGN
jgi:hypothetical protein